MAVAVKKSQGSSTLVCPSNDLVTVTLHAQLQFIYTYAFRRISTWPLSLCNLDWSGQALHPSEIIASPVPGSDRKVSRRGTI